MRKNFYKILTILFMMVVTFLLSFYQINKVYYLFSLLTIFATLVYNEKYVIFNFIAMLVAGIIININVLPISLILSICITYIMFAVFNKIKIPLIHRVSILGSTFMLVSTIFQDVGRLNDVSINILLIPGIAYFITYSITSFCLEIKNKEKFSITKNELVFSTLILNMLFQGMTIENINFKVGFIFVTILNYILVRIDSSVGLLGCLTSAFFGFQTVQNNAVLYLLPLVFTFDKLSEVKYIKSLVLFSIGVTYCVLIGDRGYLNEILLSSAIVFFISNKIVNSIDKYIIEPKDYKLKLYQENYYKCINRNKKIQRVSSSLESYLKANPKLKKYSKDLILDNMRFLSDKLKEEDNIHIKDQIIEDLKYSFNETISLKIYDDYLDNYRILMDVRSEENIDTKK